MTDQPTDRELANGWLNVTANLHNEGADPLRVIGSALAGIGHALLAGLLEPVEQEHIPATDICLRCGRNDHLESAHEEAANRIAARDRGAHDDGGHEGLPPGDTDGLPSGAHTIGAGVHIPTPTDQQ